MFSFFFKKNEKKVFQFRSLGADMHSHLLPGIDDGAKNIEDSLTLIKALVEMGYKRLITTPHIMSEVYPNDATLILGQLELVRNALKKAEMDVNLSAAAEYFIDDAFLTLLKQKKLLTLFDNYVLVEQSFMYPLPRLFDHFFQIERHGYTAIFAHPERYAYYHQNYNIYAEIREKGVKLQLNLLSLTGYYGASYKEIAIRLLKDKLIDFIGTDVHHTRHTHALNQLAQDKSTTKLLLDSEFKNHCIQ